MSEFLIFTLKTAQSLVYNKDLMNHISMELCLFQFSLQSAGFQILCLAMVLFIGYSFQRLYFLSDQENGRQFFTQKKESFLDWFQVMISGAPWYLLGGDFLFNHFIPTITQKKSNQVGKDLELLNEDVQNGRKIMVQGIHFATCVLTFILILIIYFFREVNNPWRGKKLTGDASTNSGIK